MGVLDSNIRTSIVLFHDTWSSVPHLDTLTSWVLWISTPSRLPIERRGGGVALPPFGTGGYCRDMAVALHPFWSNSNVRVFVISDRLHEGAHR